MRLPNHYGTVYKLPGKRRRPYVAKKFVGKTLSEASGSVRVQYKVVGYYETRKAALDALSAFNQAPYDLSKSGATLSQIYDTWSAVHYTKIRTSASYKSAWKVLAPIHDMRMEEIRLDTVQAVLDNSGKHMPVLKNVRMLISQLYDYAVIHEYIPARPNPMNRLDIGRNNPDAITRRIFQRDEISPLWGTPDPLNRVTLILICTGMRISELVEIRDVDLERQVMHIKQAKTAAGVRDVPIADRIVPLVEWYISTPRASAANIREQMKSQLHHLPHDTRHTFASLAVEEEIDQRLIDEILGHAHQSLTLDVYSHLGLQRKLDAVNRIVSNL